MIHLKSPQEITVMKEGGRRLKLVVKELLPLIKAGVTTREIDTRAEKLIREQGCQSSFKTVSGYPFTICSPINEQIVHTKPSNRVLKEGDVMTLDIGLIHGGLHTDYALTKIVGENKVKSVHKFLEVGENTLYKAIKKAKAGNHLGDISAVIEKEIVGHGYFIIKELTGHGIGKKLHEDPYVFGYLDRPINKTLLIKQGLVIAIEVIYAQSTDVMVYEEDDWSIRTKDRSLSGCFEHTIAVTAQGPAILT